MQTKTKKSYYRLKSKTIHMCINVKGILRNHAKTKKITYFDEDDGQPMEPKKAYQLMQLADYEGKRVIPMNDECYRFSYETGCPGHITSLKPNEEKLAEIELEMQNYLNSQK